jgi:hypothetical protein
MSDSNIDLSTAIRIALEAVEQIYSGELIKDIKIEEFDKTSEAWLITVGFDVIRSSTSFLPSKRQFKTLEINLFDGSVKSMKIKNI